MPFSGRSCKCSVQAKTDACDRNKGLREFCDIVTDTDLNGSFLGAGEKTVEMKTFIPFLG
jgi:hypothetical protein